ncbi:MAG: hypothetical protein NVS1B3_10970 [Candidatus Dormibacteraceae bacterium]
MRKLLRKPLSWMVIAECVVIAVLLMFVWNAVASSMTRHAVAAPVQAAESPLKESIAPLPDFPQATKPAARSLLPGLNLDAGFWRRHLNQLNKEQVTLEQIEWRIVHNAMDVIHRYLETVVLPSITRAERGGNK